MNSSTDLKEIEAGIKTIKDAALELEKKAESFPSLEKNVARILAIVKMLEINISDLIHLIE